MSATTSAIELMSTHDAAARLGLSEPTVRRQIRREVEAATPDTLRTVPGGRCAGERYVIFRRVFDAVLSEAKHIEPDPTIPTNPFIVRRNVA